MFDDTLAEEIWNSKYRFVAAEASPAEGDADYASTTRRVAQALALAEILERRDHWRDDFSDAMRDFRFMPAGRVLAGAGTARDVTLFNCFVMGTIPDTLKGIFDHLQEAALTMQQGGGVGMDFSTIRPKGAAVRGVGAEASGPLSFMDCWDSMCRTVQSAGARRGAMMGCLRVDHPDIEGFIDAKRDPGRFRNFNVSVLVTDEFMAALGADGDWPLSFNGTLFKTLRARDLWDQLMQATYDCAEPGVIFVDRVNRANNLAYCEAISASNPCGEQMLPPYGACLLGSINLARLVRDPFEQGAAIETGELAGLVHTAVRMLDNVIDVSLYPLPEQEAEAKDKRRIGLGITGLADALLFCSKTYGSSAAVELTRSWLTTIKQEAYRASALLAQEKGAFPAYDKVILDQPNLIDLDEDVRELVGKHGLRNGCLTSIAPTGTTSMLAGNVSSGIEPVFAYSYDRRILRPDGTPHFEPVVDFAMKVWRDKFGDAPVSEELFVSAQTLTPSDHLAMQAAAQALIDSSISKTVNCPEDIDFDAFADIYVEGYHLGCKGLTTYRPNAITGSVLSAPSEQKEQFKPETLTLTPREDSLGGTTYKLKWPDSPHALYITINDLGEEANRRPFEIFVNSKNMEHYAWTLALTRMISAVFRRGGDVSFVAEELKAVFDPRGGAWMKGRYVPSLLAAIGDIVMQHLEGIKGSDGASNQVDAATAFAPDQKRRPPSATCPQCGSYSTVKQEGCLTCTDCGYSKCG